MAGTCTCKPTAGLGTASIHKYNCGLWPENLRQTEADKLVETCEEVIRLIDIQIEELERRAGLACLPVEKLYNPNGDSELSRLLKLKADALYMILQHRPVRLSVSNVFYGMEE